MAYNGPLPEVVNAGGTGRATLTNHGVLVGAGTTAITQLGAGSIGQVLQSGGASGDPAYSTATFPSTATGTGKVLIADGTNWVASTPTFPNASATTGKIIISDGTNWIASTPTYPAAAGSSGNILKSDGTNWTSAAPGTSSITITGDTGGGLTGSSFTFTGGTTGLSFGGSGSTETVSGTLAIANGGTDATSFTQSNGIVTYNGTRLVNYAGPQISSAGVLTNTAQPAFYAYLPTSDANVTGDGTLYKLGSGNTLTIVYDQASNFVNTGTFTAPVTGKYHFDAAIYVNGCTVASNFIMRITIGGTSAATYDVSFFRTGSNLNYQGIISVDVPMTATDTAIVGIAATGEAGKTDDIVGEGTLGGKVSRFSGHLIC